MKRAHQRGFTLVEMMASLAILVVVVLVMASTFLVGYKAVNSETRTIAGDTAVSDASVWLTRDLSSASTLPTGTINRAGSLSLTYGSPAVTVTYSVDAGNNLVRTVAGTGATAARGISSVVIAAAGCYATVTIQPSAIGTSASTLNVGNRPGGCF